MNKHSYKKDILGYPFEKLTLDCKEDYEGEVKATLIRRKCHQVEVKAVLHIHGFNDYFFHKEMAENFNKEGYNFYALDLRKYGRSYMNHQKFNNVRDLAEYDEEILKAIKIISSEGNEFILLSGHSTGGLIVSLFAEKFQGKKLIDAVFLNSPFFAFNLTKIERNVGIPVISTFARFFPDIKIDSGLNEVYGESLHISRYGEWNYEIPKKPIDIPPVNAGWIKAIHEGHKKINKGISIDIPILMMHSDKSRNLDNYETIAQSSDIVLNVDSMIRQFDKIHGITDRIEIKDGIHDLVLSRREIRQKVYKFIFDWLNKSCKKLSSV